MKHAYKPKHAKKESLLDGHEDAAGNFEHFHQENDQ